MIKSFTNTEKKPLKAYIGNQLVWEHSTPVEPTPEASPVVLFANGEQGVWFDPSDLTTMFQDVDELEPVTKDGDPVAMIMDKSGNGLHATQATAAARPIYRTDGQLHWLEFDGIDDVLETEGVQCYPLFVVSAGMRSIIGGASIYNRISFGPAGELYAENGISFNNHRMRTRNKSVSLLSRYYTKATGDVAAHWGINEDVSFPIGLQDGGKTWVMTGAGTPTFIKAKFQGEEQIIYSDAPEYDPRYIRPINIGGTHLTNAGSIAFYGGVYVGNYSDTTYFEDLDSYMNIKSFGE